MKRTKKNFQTTKKVKLNLFYVTGKGKESKNYILK